MKKMVRHEAELDTVRPKRIAGRWLYVLMLLLAIVLPGLFLSMRTQEADAVAAGILILAPSLFYTSLLTTAATGTARMRRVYRGLGLLMALSYLLYFSAQAPNQLASVVLAVVGIAYCLLADVFSPHCIGEASSWRDLWSNRLDSKNRLMSTTGAVPAGLKVEAPGDFLWGIPRTDGSFTLQVWDAEAAVFRDVTYDVTVRDPAAPPAEVELEHR